MLGERFNEHQHRFQTLGYFVLSKSNILNAQQKNYLRP